MVEGNEREGRQTRFKVYQCRTCGYLYDEEAGAPDEGLPPGTRWEDVPEDWICPACGTTKSDFDMVEIDQA